MFATGEEVFEPRVEMALDTIGRGFGEQGGVPDCIESTWYVKGDGCHLMSGIVELHPLLGKQEQQVQCQVTWSESKLMIGNQAIGEEEGQIDDATEHCMN